MIITCPECSTRYVIKSEKLGLDPKKVRCVKCRYQWTVSPTPQAEDQNGDKKPPLPPIARLDSPSLMDQQKKINSRIKKRNVVVFSILVGFILTSLTVLVVFRNDIVKVRSDLATIYEMLGLELAVDVNNFTGLEIQNVERKQETRADMTVLTFSGEIKNVSDIEVPVPNVKVQLFNEDNILLDEWTAQAEHRTLKPGEITVWTCRFYDPPLSQISQYKTFFEK